MKKLKRIYNEFISFATKGDAISLAIGIVIGGAFKGVIDSLVNDIIMPPIGYITAKIDFSKLFIALGNNSYLTIEEAKSAGAVVIAYGNFINQLIIFLITSIALFIFGYKLIQFVQKRKESENKENRKCPYCYSVIHKKATKCPNCTSSIKN